MDGQNSGSSSKAQPANMAFDFLELPKELRLCIYEYLLKPALIEIYSFDVPSIVGLDDDEVAKSRFYADPVGTRLYPEILRACKTIHAEAHSILYMPTSLELRSTFQHTREEVSKELDHVIDARKLGEVRQLDELCLDLTAIKGSKDEDLAHSRVLAKLINPRMKISTLAVRVRRAYDYNDYEFEEAETDPDTMMEIFNIWASVIRATTVKLTAIETEDGNKTTCVIGWSKHNGEDWHRTTNQGMWNNLDSKY